jgi:hypothetical protein
MIEQRLPLLARRDPVRFTNGSVREWFMPRARITFDTVRQIGRALPGVEESTMYGAPALKLNGRLVACIPTHKSAERDSIAVRCDFERRSELLATDPDVYYLKDHYVNHPVVLARLSRIHPDALRDLLGMSYRFVAAKKASRKR